MPSPRRRPASDLRGERFERPVVLRTHGGDHGRQVVEGDVPMAFDVMDMQPLGVRSADGAEVVAVPHEAVTPGPPARPLGPSGPGRVAVDHAQERVPLACQRAEVAGRVAERSGCVLERSAALAAGALRAVVAPLGRVGASSGAVAPPRLARAAIERTPAMRAVHRRARSGPRAMGLRGAARTAAGSLAADRVAPNASWLTAVRALHDHPCSTACVGPTGPVQAGVGRIRLECGERQAADVEALHGAGSGLGAQGDHRDASRTRVRLRKVRSKGSAGPERRF